MSALTDDLAAIELGTTGETCHRDAAARPFSARRLSLRPTEDGWSLVAPDGEVVFQGFGIAGRRQCLKFARDLGVLAVLG